MVQVLTVDKLLAVIEAENREGAPPGETATVKIVSDPELQVATESGEIGAKPHKWRY